MEKEFVPYELAVKLDSLGYFENNEQTFFGGWDKNSNWMWHPDSDIILDAPLWQQAFDWFSINHGLFYLVESVASCDLRCVLIQHPGRMYHEVGGTYENYHAAYKACLEKLIELISK